MALFSKEKKEGDEWRDGVYLTTVGDSMAADILESKLRGEGIPCVRRYQGAGNFMEIALGSNTITDIELFVPAEMLEDAKNVIVPVALDEEFDPGEADPDEDVSEPEKE